MEIYADNAATTKMSQEAIDKMLPFLRNNFGNASSIHTLGQKSKEALCYSREKIAKILNCDRRELIFTSCGSEADNQAILSAAEIGANQNKKHIISTVFEHHAVLNTLKKLENKGFELTLLPVEQNGIISIKKLQEAIRPDTCLITVMYANNEIGTIQPIKEIGSICRSKNIIFHTDAVQAIGHIQIDVKEENIDMLSLSAHKFNGPKGIGALYVKKGINLVNIIEGGAQERGKRAGTENIPAIVGMSIALEEASKNLKTHDQKLKILQTRLISGLSKIPHSILNGDRNNRLSNNTNFSFEGIEGESLLLLLNDRGIYASSGSACSSGSLAPSHVLLAIGRSKDIAQGSLRLTLSPETTEEEVDYIIKTVSEVVEYLRKMSPTWKKNFEANNFVLN